MKFPIIKFPIMNYSLSEIFLEPEQISNFSIKIFLYDKNSITFYDELNFINFL